MRQFIKFMLLLVISTFLFLSSACPVFAEIAPVLTNPKTITISISITDPKTFWEYPYMTHESEIAKPSQIQVEWDAGDGKTTRTTVVTQGKDKGEFKVVTEKGTLINLRVIVSDSHGVVLGSCSLQERNKGQTDNFSITYPEFTEPLITPVNGATQTDSQPH